MRSTDRDAPISMIGRVDAVLSAFTPADRSLGVNEIARRTALPKASVSRIAAELVERRILERWNGGLRLGIRLFELGEHAARPNDLRRLALAHMADLRGATGQTVHLAVLEGSEVVYIDILRARDAPALPSRVGGRVPAYATGVGKALLARLPEEGLDAVLPAVLAPVGPRTIVDREALDAELAAVRAAGVAYEREESGPGVGCAAAAVIGADGAPIAALSVSVRLADRDLDALGPAVSTAAAALTRMAARHHIRSH